MCCVLASLVNNMVFQVQSEVSQMSEMMQSNKWPNTYYILEAITIKSNLRTVLFSTHPNIILRTFNSKVNINEDPVFEKGHVFFDCLQLVIKRL